jgi:plastocyanin
LEHPAPLAEKEIAMVLTIDVRVSAFSLAVMSLAAAPPPASALHGTATVSGRPSPNVVVWLDAPHASQVSDNRRVVLDQRNLTFNPHVLVVRVGTVVEFPNNDRVFHNVFSFHDGKRFDLGIYPVGTLKRITFDQPGLSRIFCNIHPNMAAYVMVVDTPFFGVSDAAGEFTLAPVPAGRYTYHAWRPGAPQLSGTWSADADQPLRIEWR